MSPDLDLDAIRARYAGQLGHPPTQGGPGAEDDVLALVDALELAGAETKEFRELSDDLRASAEIWERLYAANVTRANGAEAERDVLVVAVATAPPSSVASRLPVMTHALETLIRTCEVCGRGERPLPDAVVCPRCELARAALRPSASDEPE